MKVVLISGKAQHGKDTVASMIKRKLRSDGHKVLVTHYGDLVKYICKEFFEWDGKKDIPGRWLLQTVGTDRIRSKYPDFWVDFIHKILTCFPREWDYVLIPDCRFPNEIETIVKSGMDAVHLRVIRGNFESPLTEEQQKHPSETALDSYTPDCWVSNDGTIRDLNMTIEKWVEETLYAKN